MTTTKFGKESEDKAVKFLENNDFIIIERNFYAKKLGFAPDDTNSSCVISQIIDLSISCACIDSDT